MHAAKKIFWVKHAEKKKNPTEGPSDESKFERKFGSKTTELVVIIMGPLSVCVIDVNMESGFVYVPAVAYIKNRGIFNTATIKNNYQWQKSTEAQEEINGMQDKYLGTSR